MKLVTMPKNWHLLTVKEHDVYHCIQQQGLQMNGLIIAHFKGLLRF